MGVEEALGVVSGGKTATPKGKKNKKKEQNEQLLEDVGNPQSSPSMDLSASLSTVTVKKSAIANMTAKKVLPKSKTISTLNLSKVPAILSPTQKQRQMKDRTDMLDGMMGELEEKAAMTDDEILSIIEFMDFNNSGEVDETEFNNAVRQAKRGMITDANITRLMARVDNELRLKQIRLKDLFRQLDSSGDGVLSRGELRYGLNMLCDVSWEQECERRKLRRVANHERWKEKEEVRDKTKKWLVEAEGLPKEFMEDREFFVRDIATPERFQKFLEVIVSGHQHSAQSPAKARSPRKTRMTRMTRRAEVLEEGRKEFAFDLHSIDGEEMHERLLKIVDDEMSVESRRSGRGGGNNNDDEDWKGDDSSGGTIGVKTRGGVVNTNKGKDKGDKGNQWTRRRRGSVGRRGRRRSFKGVRVSPTQGLDQMEEATLKGLEAAKALVAQDDESSLASVDSVFSPDQSTVASLASKMSKGDGSSVANQTFVTAGTHYTIGSTMSAASSAMLSQIHRSRGVKEQSDSDIESLVMLLGLNKRSVLSMKQRHFEERTFKNLYKARTSSLSNDYYLPKTVIDVMEREEMMKENKSGVVKRRKSVAEIIRRVEEEREMMEREWQRYNGMGEDSIEEMSCGDGSESVVSMLPFDEFSIGSANTIKTEEGIVDVPEEEFGIPLEIQFGGGRSGRREK